MATKLTNAELRAEGLGQEPKFNDNELTRIEVIKALNWYNTTSNAVECKKWLIEWASSQYPKEIIEALKLTPPVFYTNEGFIAKMIKNGAKLSPTMEQSFNVNIKRLADIGTDLVVDRPKTKVTQIKDLRLVELFELSIDNLSFDPNLTLPNGMEPTNAKQNIKIIRNRISEIDSDIKNNTHCYDQAKSRKIITLCDEWSQAMRKMVKSINQELRTVKSSTKSVTTKATTKGKKVSDSNSNTTGNGKVITRRRKTPEMQLFNQDWSVNGVDIKTINNTKVAFIFDTKYGKLIKLESDDILTVSGNKIEGVARATYKNLSKHPNFFRENKTFSHVSSKFDSIPRGGKATNTINSNMILVITNYVEQ
jgi:hypothetical protein